MAQFFEVHPDNPQPRLIRQAVEIINKGGVIVYPTDSAYALGCHIGDKAAMDRIRHIRRLDDKHNFTLLCTDLSQVSTFTRMGNDAHRLIKKLTPGPFTFLLDATHEVPRRLQHAKKKTIGVRIPNNTIAQQLVEELGEPLLTSTLILPGEAEPLNDPYEIRELLEHQIDLVISSGYLDTELTTVIACSDQGIDIVRQGKGYAPMLENGL